MLLGTDLKYESVIRRFEDWSTGNGWRHRPLDKLYQHPDKSVKEVHHFDDPVTLKTYRRKGIVIWWVPSEHEPSKHGHAHLQTYYWLTVRYHDTRCFDGDN